jgi:hypothetical protein
MRYGYLKFALVLRDTSILGTSEFYIRDACIRRLFFSFYKDTVLLETCCTVFKKTKQILPIGNNAFILGFYVYLIKNFIIPESQELLVVSLVHMST